MMKLSSASNEGKFNCSLFTISEYGYRLRRVFETLSRDYGLGLNLDSYDWDGYIYLWLSDILSLKLMWSEATKLFDDELAGEFPWFNKDNSETSDFHQLSDSLFLELTSVIDYYLPKRTYTIWALRRHNDDSVILIEGADYRILAWEDAVRQGILTHPFREKSCDRLSTILASYFATLPAKQYWKKK